jgi:type I restriction enzyme M protein
MRQDFALTWNFETPTQNGRGACTMSDVVQQLGEFWHTLRYDGVDYGAYIEHLTYLLFLKMADERGIELPKECDWPSLMGKSGAALQDHYVDLLRKLAAQRGLLGEVFCLAHTTFNNPVSLRKLNPVNLRRLLSLIDETDLTALDIDAGVAQFEGRSTGISSAAANEALDSGVERQVFRLLILCRRLLAILINESPFRH